MTARKVGVWTMQKLSVKQRRQASPVERGRDKTARLKREAIAKRYKRSVRIETRVQAQFEAAGRYIGKAATVDTVRVSVSGHASKDIMREKYSRIVMK